MGCFQSRLRQSNISSNSMPLKEQIGSLDEAATMGSFTAEQVKFSCLKDISDDRRSENMEPILHTYKPLEDEKSIRLLRCSLGPDQASMIFEVCSMSLDEAIDRFVAVSYCWGTTPPDRVLALVDGSHILVGANVETLLTTIFSGREGLIWLDAICINQGNDAEKSHQVLLMRDIYANASRVLAWIGKPDSLSGLAFDTLERFAADDGTPNGSATFQQILDSAEERRAAIKLLIERSYFERVWVVQELVVAKTATIFCGSFSIAFDELYFAMERMTGSGFYQLSTATTNITYLGDWRSSYLEMATAGRKEEREEILGWRIFVDSRDRKATDLRDKIFSLRGIAYAKIAAGIRVDYSHHNSVERVYTDFTKLVLKNCPNLSVLSAVIGRHRADTTLLLPSWVPDWSQPKYGGGILNRYYRFEPRSLFRAGGPLKPRVTVAEDSDTLCLEGFRLDIVNRVIPIKSILVFKNKSYVVTEAILRELAAQLTSLENYPFTGEPFWVAFFRTLSADRTALSPRIKEEYRNKFLVKFTDWKLNHEEIEQSLPAQAWAEVSKAIATIIEDKDMFLTERGYLGLGHEGFQIGDVVCVFTGGETPFLLREGGAPRSGIFQLLSECYVHGVMDGEVMQSLESKCMECFEIE